MSEQKNEVLNDEVSFNTDGDLSENNAKEEESTGITQEELSDQYTKLPVWKQAVILILCLVGMTAVIMLINFIVEFGAEIIKALIK